ncbi:MAG: c-type cytochrome [Phycisphaerae bacterium]|nr:c-type cytochrome [Phycisphaerae bacterium]
MTRRSLVRLWIVVPLVIAAAGMMVVLVATGASTPAEQAGSYHSPVDVAFSPDGKWLATCDYTAGEVALVDPAENKLVRQVAVNGEPAGLAWAEDSAAVYVAERSSDTVAVIDPAKGKVTKRLDVGRRPTGLAMVPNRKWLLVTNSGGDDVSVVDLATGKEKGRVAVVREPVAVAVTPDGTRAVVANLLPAGDATDPTLSAAVSVIDLDKLERIADVRLPGGSTSLRDVAVSPDGQWAYVVHTLGRFTLPTTHLERGWVNTNAMSIVRLAGPEAPATQPANTTPPAKKAPAAPAVPADVFSGKPELYATLLLDRVTEGAADPWGLALSRDGKTAWVTLAGVHQLARIDLERLHPLLAGQIPGSMKKTLDELNRYRQAGVQVTWLDIKADRKNREQLANDLAALHVAGALQRTPLTGAAPRGLDLAPDGKTLAVAMYFSGTVLIAGAPGGEVAATITIGKNPPPDLARRGEMIFHDANYCFQHWLSCATCHPSGGRADGLNWDLLNDGMGNPKNTRSLVLAGQTQPKMAMGIRPDMETATKAGFRFILFREPQPEDLDAVNAYIRSLKPEPNPHLEKGKLSKQAQRGKKLYDDPKIGCAKCHPAPLYTDMKPYDVGSRGKLDRPGDKFYSPALTELWRTAPYMHDGSSPTLKAMLTTKNKDDQHGVTSKLSEEELNDLVEYLLSL